VHLTKTSKT